MNCESVANVRDLYAEGRLTPSRQAQVAVHLKACPACADRLRSEPLAAIAAPPPKDFKEKLKKSLAQPRPEPATFRIEFSDWPVLASAAAVAALALILSVAGPGVASQQYGGSGIIAAVESLP